MSDYDKRTTKSKQSLTRRASRLAPSVANERNEFKWERGTLKTTEAVFMDKYNCNWLAKNQNDCKKTEKDQEDGKAKRAEAAGKRKEDTKEKAAARDQRALTIK